MTRQDIAFLEKLWERLSGERLVPQQLTKQIKHDGGHDVSNLSDEDLMELVEGRFAGDWKGAAFSFSELLAYYAALGKKRTKKQVVAWVFASFVIADAIKHGAADWELQFNNFIGGFLAVRNELETEESVRVFQRVFVCHESGGIETTAAS